MRIYEFGSFRVDALRRLLLREGKPVRLSGKAFEILLILLEQKGRLVTKDKLMRRVWPDAVVEENNLTVNMSALRKALGESPGEHRYLVTVPGRGYQFVADVREYSGEGATDSEATAAAAETLTEVSTETRYFKDEVKQLSPGSPDLGVGPVEATHTDGAANHTQPITSAEYIGNGIKRHKRAALVLLSALLATTIVVSYFSYSRYLAGDNKAGISSIAVLPFANNSDDPNAEYLSDGISESLINSLSQLPGLKVISINSSFKYKGKEVDIQEVAHVLGVEAILTGRVLQRGDGLIISVEMVDARDKRQLWGEQYNRKAADLFQVQTEISREIADRLRVRLSAVQQQQLARHSVVNPLAYEMLLKGRFYWNKGGDQDRKKAVDYYNQAIAIDSNYAPAYAELASAYSIFGNDGVIDPKEAAHKAEAAAVKALELDDGLAEAHQALAYKKQLAWDWAAAEREYRRAIELNPNYAEAHASYSTFLSLMGRHDQAFAEAKRAKELDPFSIRTNIWIFNTLFMSRRYDQALAILKEMQELDPNHPLTQFYFAFTYTTIGRYPEAIATYKEMSKRGDNTPSSRIYLGYTYAKAGRREEARAILRELETTKQYVSPFDLATLYAGLGENHLAFQSLERAYSAHELQMQNLGIEPGLDTLRSDPRFKDLMRRVGLPT